MALQGTIDAFPVADVLHLLAGSRKTGRLIVEGDRSTAQLFVAEGALTDGSIRDVQSADIADVVVELLRYRAGSFLFEPGAPTPPTGEEQDLVTVVATAVERLEAWAEIEAVVPSTSHRLRLVESISVDGVQLSSEDWQMVVAAGAQVQVSDLVASLGLPEIVTCARVAGLVGRGLVSVVGPAADLVPLGAQVEPPADRSADRGHDRVPDHPHGDHVVQVPELREDSDASHLAGEPAFEVVLVDDEDAAAGAFPEHFPIDDLIGADSDEDPWVQLEAAARQDRLAAAQSFGDRGIDAPADGVDAAGATLGPASFDGTGAFTDAPAGPIPSGSTRAVDAAADEVLRQMSKLSPKAAEAIAAALGSPVDAPAGEPGAQTADDGYGVPFGTGTGF